MEKTFSVFNDRKDEINFYYKEIETLERFEIKEEDREQKTKTGKLIKIMKSNFLLIIYNLIEACITLGMEEIYEQLNNDNRSYDFLIEQIQDKWSKYMINEVYGPTTSRFDYENRVKKIINLVNAKKPILFKTNQIKKTLNIRGNLNAGRIKNICREHNIICQRKNNGESLENVRVLRNNLSHGDDSFSDCAKDLTISDLDVIKKEVFDFLSDTLIGMSKYYDNKEYLKT